MLVSARAFVSMLSLLSACWLLPAADARAQQQTNRCTGPAGNTIYTDRACVSIGAIDRLPRGTASLAYRQRRGGCARTVQELIYEITTAIDTRDVNRLGAVYHWVGLNAASGDRILDRLQTVVDRPLVDVVPLRAAIAPVAADTAVEAQMASTPAVPSAATAPNPPTAAQSAGIPDGEARVSRPPVRRAAVGLRLQQTLGKSATPSQTTLGLRRHLDCWWITL